MSQKLNPGQMLEVQQFCFVLCSLTTCGLSKEIRPYTRPLYPHQQLHIIITSVTIQYYHHSHYYSLAIISTNSLSGTECLAIDHQVRIASNTMKSQMADTTAIIV